MHGNILRGEVQEITIVHGEDEDAKMAKTVIDRGGLVLLVTEW